MDPGKQSTSIISGPEEALTEPVGAQASVEKTREELTGGLDVGECEKRAREMLRVGSDASVAFAGPAHLGAPRVPLPPREMDHSPSAWV